MGTSWRLDGDERRRYETDGYLVREAVFDAGEVAEIVVACEELVAGLVADRHGPAATRTDSDLFGNLEMAPAEPGSLTTVNVEVPAGSVVMFGSLLVHQSRPNRTDGDRRALLYSYQPAGHPHLLEHLRRLLGSRTP
jgi:hypothetical protein